MKNDIKVAEMAQKRKEALRAKASKPQEADEAESLFFGESEIVPSPLRSADTKPYAESKPTKQYQDVPRKVPPNRSSKKKAPEYQSIYLDKDARARELIVKAYFEANGFKFNRGEVYKQGLRVFLERIDKEAEWKAKHGE